MQLGFPIPSTMSLGDYQGWGTKGDLGNSTGLTLGPLHISTQCC